MRAIRVYISLIRMNFLAGLQYKGWPIMLVQVAMVVVTDPLNMVLLFSRFGNIGEWTVWRLLLIYAISVTGFGLAEGFCRGFDYFPFRMIQNGEFDRALLRPCPLYWQIAGSVFHLHRFARVLSGLITIIICLNMQNIAMTPEKIAILLCAVLGGMVMYCGVFVLTSGISIFTVKAIDWIYVFTNASYQVARCPIDYLPNILRRAFTFVLPVLIISYYPASYVCGWGEPAYLAWLALPAGCIFMGLSMAVWKVGVRHYTSTGS